METRKHFWTATVLAWVLFIGIDFLFHASLLKSMWAEDIAALKPADELFALIPVGYLSFFLLTLLATYVFNRIYPERPARYRAINFSLVFAGLFAISNFFALYSYVTLPLKHLLAFNLVYFIELFTVLIFFSVALYTAKISRIITYSLLIFFALVIAGIVLQNIN